MTKKVLLALAAAVLALGCLGAGSASAATLYTDAAHTAAVPVGTTLTASIAEPPTGYGYRADVGVSPYAYCRGGSYTFKVTQNSGGTLAAAVAGGSFNGCVQFPGMTVPAGGELKVSGAAVNTGTSKAWTAANLLAYQTLGGYLGIARFSGATGNPPANGIYLRQPNGGAPISVVIDNATGLYGPPANVTATYTLTGTAAGYSLG